MTATPPDPPARPFDAIVTLKQLRALIAREDRARRLMEHLVWPSGRQCPLCDGPSESWASKTKRGAYTCGRGHRFTVTTRTPMHGTKLPLRVWLEAAALVLSSSKGLSSLVMAGQLGVTQQTAWKIAHGLRMMMDPKDEPKLEGIVEADDIAIGGQAKRRNRKYGKAGKHIHNKRGRGAQKARSLIIASRDGDIRTQPLAGLSAKDMATALAAAVSPEATVYTDGDKALENAAKSTAAKHDSVTHSQGEYAKEGGVHVNTAEGFNLFIRRGYFGVWHSWSEEHQQRYLSELGFHWRKTAAKTTKGAKRIKLPLIALLRMLFANATGRELRRSAQGGIYEPKRSASLP